jgi:hypothetical protein
MRMICKCEELCLNNCWSEYDLMACIRKKGHEGYHNYIVKEHCECECQRIILEVLMKWISCEKEQPKEEGEFIITGINPHSGLPYVTHATTKKVKDKIKWNWRGYKTVCMTHWMHLPICPCKR